MPQTQLWELATYDLKPRLNRQAGVSTVVVQGGQEPELEVTPDPAKLLQTSLTIPTLIDALGRSNLIDSPGLFESNHQLVLSLVSGQAHTPDDVSKIVVKTTPLGVPIRVGDIASVTRSVKPVYTVVTANTKPAVLLNVFRQPDSNTVAVANAVQTEIEAIRHELPNGVVLQPFYDLSELVNDSITSVRDAVIVGLVLASLIMVLFLRDWGTSLVAGLVIPATLAVTFITLRVLGESFNLMTLGGLAAAVGLVIDDAIVVVENIVTHRDAGQPRAEAIRSAIREIRVPLIGSTITPIVVFLPLISMTGVNGTFFRALAITVAMALLASLALALTWTPTLSHYVLRTRKAGAGRHENVPPRLMRVYERVLREPSNGRSCWRSPVLSSWSAVTSATTRSGRVSCRPWTRAASSSITSRRPAPRSPKRTVRSALSNRSCARRRRSRAHRGERDWSWVSPPSRKRTGAISRSSSNATAAERPTRSSRRFARR